MNDFESDLRAAQAVKQPTKQQREQAELLAAIDAELRQLLTDVDRGVGRNTAMNARALMRHRVNVATELEKAGGEPWTFTLEEGH